MINCIFSLLVLLSVIMPAQLAAAEPENKEITALEKQLSADPDNCSLLLKLGRAYHDLAAAGSDDMLEKAENIFEKLIKLQPKNGEARCWYGSTLTIKGREAWMPVSKARYVNNGLKEMDKAVELDPNNVSIRMIRGSNSLSLPDFFDRAPTAVMDFEYLTKLIEKSPNSFDPDYCAGVYLKLGLAYKKMDKMQKARTSWEKAAAASENSQAAKEALQLLEKTKE